MASEFQSEIPAEISAIFARGELVAAIAADAQSNEVLMLAWMNEQALLQTLSTSSVTYWSRSRNELWVKGETSGNSQRLVSISYDCDGDAILMKVEQTGAACHTGARSCFSREIDRTP